MNETSLKQSDFIATQPNPWRAWVAASIAAVAILGIAIGLMALLGLFRTPQDDTGTKSLAAALGLVGAVLSAVVALVGTIIKYSIDDRNARQADVEAGRNYALAVQAEQRNRIEAAIRAVDLLGENNQDATNAQMGGALLALVSLGELDLAVSLLAELYPTGRATPAVANVILAAGLRSNAEETQVAVGDVLYQNASRIQQGANFFWPIPILGWRTDLNANCRLGLVRAAAEWLVSLAGQRPLTLSEPALLLYLALDDPDPQIVATATACLRPVVKALDESYGIYPPNSPIVTVAQIAKRLAEVGNTSTTFYAQRYESQLMELYASTMDEAAQTDSGKVAH